MVRIPFSYVLTALLLATRALAQGSGNCGVPGETLAVQTDDDFSDISNCTTIHGNVFLHGYTSEDNQTAMSLPVNLQSVQGGVFCSGSDTNVSILTIQALGLSSIATQTNTSNNTSSYRNRGLIIADYVNLTEFLFPVLSTVGSDLVIARNLQVNTVQFPSLSVVLGNVDISGAFNNVSLPALERVTGSINLQSNNDFDCPSFENVSIGGFINCIKTTDPQPLPADNATTQINATATASGPASSASASASASSKSSASKTYSFSTYFQFSGMCAGSIEVDVSLFPSRVHDMIAYHNANPTVHFLRVFSSNRFDVRLDFAWHCIKSEQ